MYKLSMITTAVAVALSVSVMADESGVSLSGFGTVGAVKTNTNDAQFRASPAQPNGADRTLDWGVDSKLGVQLNIKASEQLSVVTQLLSQKTTQDNYTPTLEWAFAKVDVTPAFAVRGGRFGLPAFLVSDFRNVGYANPWVRTPVEVYGQVPLTNLDGIDVIWRHSVGDSVLTVQPYFGSTVSKLPGTDVHAKNLFGANGTFEVGSWTFRAGYTETKLTLTGSDVTDLTNGLNQLSGALQSNPATAPIGQLLLSVGAKELPVDKKSSFTGIGLTYDDGQGLVLAEYTKRKSKSLVRDTTGWYVTTGWRFGSVTPYISVSDVKFDADNTAAVLPTGIGIPQIDVPLSFLRKTLIDGDVGYDQHSTSIGVRWNAYKNIALKAQVDRVQLGDNNTGLFVNAKPNFAGSRVNVYTVAADFVF